MRSRDDRTGERQRRAWAIQGLAADGERRRSPLESEQVTLYGRAGDLRRFESKNDLTQYIDETLPGLARNTVLSRALQLWRFAKEIRAGDLIVIPSEPSNDRIAIGVVKEPYRHDPAEAPPHQDAIGVRWMRKDIERSAVRADLRAAMSSLMAVSELAENDAVRRIEALAERGMDPGAEASGERLQASKMLAEAAMVATAAPLVLPVKALLSYWGHQQRSGSAVAEIKRDLFDAGLTTDPAFTEGGLDKTVKLVAIAPAAEDHGAATEDTTEDLSRPDTLTLLIGGLPRPTEPITLDTAFEEARHIMVESNYSQLAVVDENRQYRGAVTAESIMRAHIAYSSPSLPQVIDRQAPTAYREDELLKKIGVIFEHGFVFVYSADRASIDGILTAADLSRTFGAFVEPFTILEEIENRLRWAVDDEFSLKEIRNCTRRPNKLVGSAADLFLTDYWYLLDKHWDRMGWKIPKQRFLDRLKQVTEVRNVVMHFSPDPLTQDQVGALNSLLETLRVLLPGP